MGTGGVSLFNVRSAYAQNLPNPADVLAKINVGNMVNKAYREQYKLGDNDELWDPKKDWIRTADWEAIRKEHKLHIAYRAQDGAATERTVWPFALAFFDGIRLLAAWCELRGEIRHFRIDRIGHATPVPERYATRRRDLLVRWRREQNIPEDS